ncbi:MAG TPA: hypothetical protein PKA58_36030 [Polyangium sp.]|nr:hypothetical protein [Polyangium sp.]
MAIEREIIAISQHKVWIDEPFTLVCDLNGEVTGDDLRRMREVLDYVGAGNGPIIVMQNLSKATSFSSAARKGILDDERTRRVVSVICIAASFQMRVIMTMIMKAMKLIDTPVPNMLFADNETKARELLAQERARLQK